MASSPECARIVRDTSDVGGVPRYARPRERGDVDSGREKVGSSRERSLEPREFPEAGNGEGLAGVGPVKKLKSRDPTVEGGGVRSPPRYVSS